MANTRENPYVGPHAFRTEDKKKFAGRERETLALYRLLIADRIVLLYSPSGAGKSSLVNAGLFPRMSQKGFIMFPVVRVNLSLPEELAAIAGANRYVMSMLQTVGGAKKGTSNEQLAELTIHDYLTQRLRPANASDSDGEKIVDDEEIIEPKSLLIFDQFEEILTIDPNDDQGKREFFAQLGEALEVSRRWALFVVREDYVAALDPYRRFLPTRLANTYRLDLLDHESALEAVRKPAQLMKVSYTDEAAEHLINELRRVRIQRPDGSWEPEPQLGRYVEPVQLQVVCYRLWDKIGMAGRITEWDEIEKAATITEKEISDFGKFDEALAGYYADKVAETATAEEVNIPEKDIRTWFDTALITPNNIRSQVMWETPNSGGLDNKAILYLEKTHLIRRESRRGIMWLELAHDRLIKPVRGSNAVWFENNLKPLQKHAMLWAAEGEPDRLLLRDAELTQAEEWAKDQRLSQNEQSFLEACKDLRGRVEAEESRKEAEVLAERNKALAEKNAELDDLNKHKDTLFKRVILVAILAAVFAVAAAWAGISARNYAEDAKQEADLARRSEVAARRSAEAFKEAKSVADENAKTAREQAQLAREASDRSLSLSLALNGSTLIDKNPPLAALLSVEALNVASQPQAEQNIRDLLGVNHGYLLSGHSNAITHTVFSPDSQWLVTADGQSETIYNNSVRIWNIGADDPSDIYAVPKLLRGNDWTALAISPDNQWLVLGDGTGTIVIYEFTKKDGRFGGFQIQPDQQVTALAFGHNGDKDWLAVGSADGTVALVDFSDRNLALVFSDNSPPNIVLLEAPGTQPVNILSFSQDGRWLAGGSDDFQVRVWDMQKPGSTPIPHLQKGPVVSLAFSADYLVAYGNSNILYIYNAQKPANKPDEFTAPSVFNITALAFDPRDPDRVAIGQADGTIQFFDIASLLPSPPFFESPEAITYLAFTNDGRWLVSAARDRNVRLWSVNRHYESGVVSPSTVLKTFERDITSLQLSASVMWLVAGSRDHSVVLWDLHSGFDTIEPAKLADAEKSVILPSFSEDGKWLAAIETAPDYDVMNVPNTEKAAFDTQPESDVTKVWNAEKFASGDRTPELSVDGGVLYAFSPNGKDLAVAIRKNAGVSIELFDLQDPDKAARPVISNLGDLSYLAFSPQGGRFLVAHEGEGNLYIWDTSSGDALLVTHPLAGLPFEFSFSSTGRWLAAVAREIPEENDIYLFDLENPEADPLDYDSGDGGVYDFTFSPDERWFGVGTTPAETDGNAYLWDLSKLNPEPIRLTGHFGYVNTLAFDQESKWLATGDDAGVVRLWDISGSPPSMNPLPPAHDDWVVHVSFSADEKWLVSTAADGSINLWAMDKLLSNSEEGYYTLNDHEGFVTSVVFSPKNRWLASSSVDRTIRLWNLSDPYKGPIILRGSVDEVYMAAFSPDERLLLSNTIIGDARLWHLNIGDLKALACKFASRNMSPEEWKQYLQEIPYQKTCKEPPG